MKVKLIWEIPFCGKMEKVVDVSGVLDDEMVNQLFKNELGVERTDLWCRFEIVT